MIDITQWVINSTTTLRGFLDALIILGSLVGIIRIWYLHSKGQDRKIIVDEIIAWIGGIVFLVIAPDLVDIIKATVAALRR